MRKQGADSNALNKKGELSDRYYPIYYDPESEEISVSKKLPIELLPVDTKGQKRIWRRSRDVIESMYAENDIYVKKNKKSGYQIYFRFRGGLDGRMSQSIWYDAKFSASDHGTRILNNILGERELFQYPKAPEAVKEAILAMSDSKNSIILDYFAGSGTTGQAVMELNKEDGGNRKFILCTNNENKIAEEVTYPRIRNVIEGYADVEGIPANLRYYKTDFVDVESVHDVADEKKIQLTYQAGRMIALREDTLEETNKNEWWQIFTDQKDKITAIYFKEDKAKLDELVEKIKDTKDAVLYIFSWGKSEYKNEFAEHKNIRVEDIPEPILEVYKEINAN